MTDPVTAAPSFTSDVTPAELARALGVTMPSAPGPTLDRLTIAVATAEDVVGFYTGRQTDDAWPTPFPPGPHGAILGTAVRVYRAADVTFGVLQTELGTAYTGRWRTPELEAQLLGWRRSWGVA